MTTKSQACPGIFPSSLCCILYPFSTMRWESGPLENLWLDPISTSVLLEEWIQAGSIKTKVLSVVCVRRIGFQSFLCIPQRQEPGSDSQWDLGSLVTLCILFFLFFPFVPSLIYELHVHDAEHHVCTNASLLPLTCSLSTKSYRTFRWNECILL